MKKCLIVILLIGVLCSLCACAKQEAGYLDGDTKEEKKEQQLFHEDRVLFQAQDRYNVEGDRYQVYAYNYKGEQLDVTGIIGYYAENGLAPAVNQSTAKVGYVDESGVFQIEAKYENAYPFSKDGIALVEAETEEGKTKYGYINGKGEEITPCIYDAATSFFNCGYAIARIRKEVLDEEGYKTTVPLKDYILDKNGKTVIEIDRVAEDRVITELCKDYFLCSTDNNTEIYNYSGQKLQTIENYVEYSPQMFCSVYVLNDSVYKRTCKILSKLLGIPNYEVTKTEIFDGKGFVEVKKDYEITSRQVATTQSGLGYGVIAQGNTVIPFEYEKIYEYGSYFVAVKYNEQTGSLSSALTRGFDIYDKDFNKTAENINYLFYNRTGTAAKSCQLPNGYFEIRVPDNEYGSLCGIIDYSGKVIVEPAFGRGIGLVSYEATGLFYIGSD